jgi:hypothetical protein
VKIELVKRREMHPKLPADLALVMVERAGLALQRNGHTSGLAVSWEWEQDAFDGVFSWPQVEMSTMDQHDENRITEDGAEAVVLVLSHQHEGWRVIRRMQREEHADWLLEHRDGASRQLVALEISGVDRGSIGGRVTQKLSQVAKSTDVDQQWAGVVGFEMPTATLRCTRRKEYGS